MAESDAVSRKIRRYARWGEWVATFALLPLLFVFAYIVWSGTGTGAGSDRDIVDAFGLDGLSDSLTPAQRWVGILFNFAPDVLGLAMILVARKLFIGFRTEGVFTVNAARRFRLIGWAVFLMAPASILTKTIGGLVLAYWSTRSGHLIITFDDTDVYALLLGMVVIAVSQIMLEATRLADENRAFV